MAINPFSGSSFDTYSQARTNLYENSPSKFHYDIDVNKAAGDFIQNKTNELLGNNVFSNVVGTAGKIVGAPLAALASPFHEGVQVVKENRMEPDSGILGWGKAFLDEDPFSTAMNRGIGVASSIPGFDKTKMGVIINAYKKHIENKKQNLKNIEAKKAAEAKAKADAAAAARRQQQQQTIAAKGTSQGSGGTFVDKKTGSMKGYGGSNYTPSGSGGHFYIARGGLAQRAPRYANGGLINFYRYGGFV